MKWSYNLSAPALDLSGYKKALHKEMMAAVSQGVMEWLEAVLMEIPVWSGASRATFLKLASSIQYSVPIDPVAQSRIGMGRASGAGGMDIQPTLGVYKFSYSTSLPWLIWNEYHNANVDPDPTLFYRVIKEGPYNFQVQGAKAFLKFAEGVGLPSIRPFVRAKRV